MTFGAFFATLGGRPHLREYASLGETFQSDELADVRRLLRAVFLFTFLTEALGVVLLWDLFPDQPWRERLWLSLFHSVSAFCNAGFTLTPDSFVGMATRFPVWGGLASLIILGGIGFAVVSDVWQTVSAEVRQWLAPVYREPISRRRLSLTTYLVLNSTLWLLLGGAVAIFLLERTDRYSAIPTAEGIANSWFQSVTMRSGGLHTVDLGTLQPATKLIAIALMFIGASPGSTGGGIRTTVFAVAFLGLISVMRGRQTIECRGRTIPPELITRALAVLILSLITICTTTLFLTIFEQRPDRFIHHLFEATSAGGTVGASSSVVTDEGARISVTRTLTTPSRYTIIVAMFVGRVGPLTLLLALVTHRAAPSRYNYPPERVTLG